MELSTRFLALVMSCLAWLSHYWNPNSPPPTTALLATPTENLLEAPKPPSGPPLDRIVIVARHGDRAPLERYPWDGSSLWKHGYGHLTKHGKHRMHRMGVFLRERYSHNFPEGVISPRDIFIRSSSVDRCLETAQLLTAALSPPTGDWRWNSGTSGSSKVLGAAWQPIPIYSVPRDEDGLLVQRSKCPRAIALYARILDSPTVARFMAPYEQLLADLFNSTKVHLKSHREVRDVYDSLLCLQHYINEEEGAQTAAMRHALSWVSTEQMAALKQIFERSFQFDFGGQIEPELRRLRAGLLLNKILTRLAPSTSEDQKPKLSIFSTHDSSMFHLLEAMGLEPQRSLKFGTTFLFEARHLPDSNDTAVQMFMVDARQSADPFLVKEIVIPGVQLDPEQDAELATQEVKTGQEPAKQDGVVQQQQDGHNQTALTVVVQPSSTSAALAGSVAVPTGTTAPSASLRKLRRHFAPLLIRDIGQWREECADLSGIEWAYVRRMTGRDEL